MFSPPRGVTWGGVFGMNVPQQALMTPTQARRIADDLLRRADDLDAALREDKP